LTASFTLQSETMYCALCNLCVTQELLISKNSMCASSSDLRVQVSNVVQFSPLLFWDVTPHRLVARHRCFGVAYWSHLEGIKEP
jgi:hypothetical protein